MDTCPLTGVPCSNPKVIHVTDIGAGYVADKSYDLCQVCASGKIQQTPPSEPPKAQLHPVVKNLFDLLQIILTSKVKKSISTEQPPQQPPQQPPPPQPQQLANVKPDCPVCGTTIQDILKTSKLGCPNCYEYYKTELLPLLIHAHKSSEHVGKRPKHKNIIVEDLPAEEQIKVLELQIKQAADQEKYEKAKELKDKLTILKSANPQSEPPSTEAISSD